MNYFTRPVPVYAEQAAAAGISSTGRNDQNDPTHLVPEQEPCEKGDWRVTTPNGITRVWKDAEFHQNFMAG